MSTETATLVGVIVLLIGILFMAAACDDQRKRECEQKGGQYVRLYKSSICVKPGSVIE